MTRSILTVALSLTLVAALGTAARADHRHDPHHVIANHAVDLTEQSRELYDEVRLHFRGHSHLLSDSLAVYRSAVRMHRYADSHASPATLEREMSRLENAFHHLEDTLRGASFHHGSHRHVRELMRSMDGLVHHLHDDIHRFGARRVDVPRTFSTGGFTLRLGY